MGSTALGENAKDFTVVLLCVVAAAVLIGATIDVIHSSQRDVSHIHDLALRIGLIESVDSLNPYVGLNLASQVFCGLLYDTLFTVDGDLNPVPNLALEAFVVPGTDPSMVASGEPQGSVWQYNLTHNAYWHDGTPFTADDVVWNIWLSCDVHHYNTMWAYQPYSYFIMSAEKIDNYTVRIHFWDRSTGTPVPVSWGKSIPIPMLPRHLMDDMTFSFLGMSWTGIFNDTLSPGLPIVGTGPFMATPDLYSDWLEGDHITLVKNPNSHLVVDKGLDFTVKYDQLIMRFYHDSTSIVLALRNADIDVASFPPNAYESIRNDIASGDSHVRSMTATSGPDPVGTSTQLTFNMRDDDPNPARLDITIRQAIHMAIDKSSIVNGTFLGNAVEGTTMIPSGSPWHYDPSESEKLSYDLAAANASLETNGYVDTDSDGIRECTLSSPAVAEGYVEEGRELRFSIAYLAKNYWHQEIAQYIASQTSKISIQVETIAIDERFMPFSWWLYNGMDAALVTSWGDVDPNYVLFTNAKVSWDGWSMNNYYNPTYDENYSLSVVALDPEVRKGYVDDCQRIAYDDSASIFLVYHNFTYVYRNDTFLGWGDWAAHPGRCLNSIWGPSQVIFDLTPVSDQAVLGPDPGPAFFAVVGSVVGIVVFAGGMMVFLKRHLRGKGPSDP